MSANPRYRGWRGRRIPTAPAPKTRLLTGTPPRQHSHIQVIARDHTESADNVVEHNDNVPTFRSPSLQFQFPSTAEDPTNGTTFADMARRYNKRDVEGEGEARPPTSGPGAFPNRIKLQPNSRKKKNNNNNNKSWRSMKPSDVGDDKGSIRPDASGDNDSSGKVELEPSRSRASHLDLPPLQTDLSIKPSNDASAASSASPEEHKASIDSIDTSSGVVENYTSIFGKLPDPIRLHEETGTSDGQVLFIGHPNRDVTAHQWSAPSFQWVNIGQYSHTRGKIEGSLASDRLRGLDRIPNTIERFKAMAERREINIRENGRQEERKSADPPSAPRVRLPDFADAAHVTSRPNASGSAGEQAPLPRMPAHVESHAAMPMSRTVTGDYLEDPFITSSKVAGDYPDNPFIARAKVAGDYPENPFITRAKVAGDYLEDPFITRAKVAEDYLEDPFITRPTVPAALPFNGPPGPSTMGMMDFGFEFPPGQFSDPRAMGLNVHPPEISPQQLSILLEQERLGLVRHGIYPREHDFGGMPTGRVDLYRKSAYRPSLPAEAQVAVSDVQGLRGTARTMFPPPGLTVANPHRVVSTLNANAAPYMAKSTTHTRGSGESESKMATGNVPPMANFLYNDPDGIRPPNVHRMANRQGYQAPTTQLWKGPFFTETMPTTQMSEEEKLSNWFRNGQQPARQQVHAMANAGANPRNRASRYFGAIGDGSPRMNHHVKYENAPVFFKLIDNLSVYVEQSPAGVRTEYFTRVWRPALVSECDNGPDCNNSFFAESYGPSPLAPRPAFVSLQPPLNAPRGPKLDGYGRANHRSLPTGRHTHGVNAEGRFDWPNATRH